MLPNKTDETVLERYLKLFLISIFCGAFFYTQAVHADVPTLDSVIQRLTDNIPQLIQLLTAFAYVFGTYFVIIGVMEMKHFGESRGMMSQEHGIKKPILYFVIGAALIYLPSSVKTGMQTLWLTPNPMAYVVEKGNPWSQLIGNSFLILQFIGLIAFIRGLIILTQLGGHGGQQGTFAKGMTHIIGGILCINMYDTINMILATLGLDTLFS